MFNALKKPRQILQESSLPPLIGNIWLTCKFIFKIYVLHTLILFPFFITGAIAASGSMTPTIATGDIMLTSSMCYGFKLAGLSKLTKSVFCYKKPTYGDVVVINSNLYSGVSAIFSPYTKRVIAIEKDRVQIKAGIVHINGVAIKLNYKGIYSYEKNNQIIDAHLYEETLPNGTKYNVIYNNPLPSPNISEFSEEYVIPKGHYFLMGDNRDNSQDSRSLLAYVSEKQIFGKVILVLSLKKFNLRWAH